MSKQQNIGALFSGNKIIFAEKTGKLDNGAAGHFAGPLVVQSHNIGAIYTMPADNLGHGAVQPVLEKQLNVGATFSGKSIEAAKRNFDLGNSPVGPVIEQHNNVGATFSGITIQADKHGAVGPVVDERANHQTP